MSVEHYVNLHRIYGPKPIVFGREAEQREAFGAMAVAIERRLGEYPLGESDE